MKVNIQKVSMKNFISVGSKPIVIDFRNGLFRVTGDNLDNNTRNGVGKSTVFLDSLMFGLFGKPVRKIKLTDIPNTTNQKKKCEVKVWLSIEDKNYMIHRGIAPGFLKLYSDYTDGDENVKNNENEAEDSAKKFTQQKIDDLIGSNFNTFSHLLIMSNTYTAPFLDLDTKKKREIIENILGISVFGNMSDLAKTDSLEMKGDIKVIEKDYELNKSAFETLEENIEVLKTKSNEFEVNKKKKLTNVKKRLVKIKNEVSDLENEIVDEETSNAEITKNKDLLKRIGVKIKNLNEDKANYNQSKKYGTGILKKLEDKPICPICNTNTDSEHIKDHIIKLQEEANEADVKINEIINNINKLAFKEEELEDKIDKLKDQLSTSKHNIKQINSLKEEKERIKEEVSEIQNEKNNFLDLINEDELVEKEKLISDLESKLTEVSTKRKYYEYIRKLLSEDGVKNYIIKKILSFWNSKVNYYLNELNAEFSIQFDELLNAVIKSRNKSPLSYHSFSGGEKARIDVAILMSIIDISKIQNSIDLNVMVIDELLDGGLDDNGREDVLNLFKYLTNKQNKSIYVISHNANLPLNLFDQEINLIRKNGFTSIQ